MLIPCGDEAHYCLTKIFVENFHQGYPVRRSRSNSTRSVFIFSGVFTWQAISSIQACAYWYGETTLLDANRLSSGKTFYEIGNFSVSHDHKLLAFAEDEFSQGVFRVRLKDISKDEYFADKISGVSPALAWASDNQTLFYVRKHPETLLLIRYIDINWRRTYYISLSNLIKPFIQVSLSRSKNT